MSQDFWGNGRLRSVCDPVASSIVHFRYEICAYPNKLTSGGRCTSTIYSWSQDSSMITIYHRQLGLLGESQLMGTASVISDGVLAVQFPAYRNHKLV